MAERRVPAIFKIIFPNWFKTVEPGKVISTIGEKPVISGEVLFTKNKRLWEFYQTMTDVEKNKQARMVDYEEMIRDPVTLSAIELLAEDSFAIDEKNRSVNVISKDKKIKENTLQFLNDFDIEEKIGDWAFQVPFYGEVPIRVFGENDTGITSINSDIHPLDFYRIQSGSLFGFMTNYDVDPNTSRKQVLAPWELVHMFYKRSIIKKKFEELKMVDIGNKKIILDSFEVIGFLESVRATFKKLKLVEDSLILARLDRAPLKRVFYIDTGDADPAAKIQIINEFKKNYKEEIGFTTDGYYKSETNPISFGQELFIPISEGIKNIEVNEYGGNVDVTSIVDVEYLRSKFMAGLKTNKNFLGMCLIGETRIKLLDNTQPTIKEMFKNQSKYLGKGVFTCDRQGNVGVSPITSISCNRKNTDFVRVILDNGKSFDVTPDHPCQMRNGSFVEAQNLKPGDSLMPLYTSVRRSGYRFYKNNKTRQWRHVHRLVTEYKCGELVPEGYLGHHVNKDKLNNDFDNIMVMDKEEHGNYHSDILRKVGKRQRTQAEIEELMSRDRTYMKGDNNVMRDPEVYARYLENIDLRKRVNWTQKPENKEKMIKSITKAQEPRWGNNHKVVSVEILDVIEDAYDLTVESRDHCFAIAAGVFVHNTEDLPGSLGESALVRLEIRYARTVKANRRAVMNGLFRLAQIHNAYLGLEVSRENLSLDAEYISTAEEEEQRKIFSERVGSSSEFLRFLNELGVQVTLDNQKLIEYFMYDMLKLTELDFKTLVISVEKEPDIKKELKMAIAEEHIKIRGDEIYETPMRKEAWIKRYTESLGESPVGKTYDITRNNGKTERKRD